jgi:quercetin dioxygenase-like cupin family protein
MGGLILARNLSRAAGLDASARRSAVDQFVMLWRTELDGHFEDEERLLLPLMTNQSDRDRLVAEHRELRSLAQRCEEDPAAFAEEPGELERAGRLLNDHIRWEERELFEQVQRDHPGVLDTMLGAADEIEHRRPGAKARCRLEVPEPASPFPPARDAAGVGFDLAKAITVLRRDAAKSGVRKRVLYQQHGRTIVLFCMDAGARINEHSASGTVTVQPLDGWLRMFVAGEPSELQAGSMLVIPPAVRHDVEAVEPAAFLLQISGTAPSPAVPKA